MARRAAPFALPLPLPLPAPDWRTALVNNASRTHLLIHRKVLCP
jgi:hypothetical protein